MKTMKRLLTTLAIILLGINLMAQTATYQQVVSKEVKGNITEYVSSQGISVKETDTLVLGPPTGNHNDYAYIQQEFAMNFYPLKSQAIGSRVTIKNMKASSKLVYLWTTKPSGGVYGLYVSSLEGALESGEISVMGMITSDQALEMLKKEKDKLDLGLITQEEFDKKKEELSKYIK